MTDTFERLSAILTKEYKVTADQLTLDATLESLDIDSLGTVELLWLVEDTFKITLPQEPGALETLADVVRLIDNLMASPGTAGADISTGLGASPAP